MKFDPIGPERLNTQVNAPALLLCVAFETIASEIAIHAGATLRRGAKRTLSYYGFAAEEEAGVLDRLRVLGALG